MDLEKYTRIHYEFMRRTGYVDFQFQVEVSHRQIEAKLELQRRLETWRDRKPIPGVLFSSSRKDRGIAFNVKLRMVKSPEHLKGLQQAVKDITSVPGVMAPQGNIFESPDIDFLESGGK